MLCSLIWRRVFNIQDALFQIKEYKMAVAAGQTA